MHMQGACGDPRRRLKHIGLLLPRSLHGEVPAGPKLACSQCQRAVHMLCLAHPCLSAVDLPEGCWVCPCCSQPNTLPVEAALSTHWVFVDPLPAL